jgi:hypothetical protein
LHCHHKWYVVHCKWKENWISMFQRCVLLLILVGFLASQLASIPHVHGAAEPRGHHATPHFHWKKVGHSHHHGHSHAGNSHQHRHAAHCQEVPADTGLINHSEHEADAIYVPGLGTVTPNKRELSTVTYHFAVIEITSHWFVNLPTNFEADARWHPPDKAWDVSNLYLTLRKLRI